MSALARNLVARTAAAAVRAAPAGSEALGCSAASSSRLGRPACFFGSSSSCRRWASSSSSSSSSSSNNAPPTSSSEGASDGAALSPAGEVAGDSLPSASGNGASPAAQASSSSSSPSSAGSSSASLEDILGAALSPSLASDTEPTARSGRPSRVSILSGGGPRSLHRLHIQTTRNNTILTFTKPTGETLASASGGTAGFKKSQRSGYEAGYRAAFQIFGHIAAYRRTLGFGVGASKDSAIARRLGGLVTAHTPGDDLSIETVWSGFGQGREAVFRALMTNEGQDVRNLVKRVTDGTPLKIGGVRPKKRRML
ncbi:hypothetical protein OC844_005887 [Tilletia horrida]|nr:hypothetical protein OC844_005887 [Tilletia horrida]